MKKSYCSFIANKNLLKNSVGYGMLGLRLVKLRSAKAKLHPAFGPSSQQIWLLPRTYLNSCPNSCLIFGGFGGSAEFPCWWGRAAWTASGRYGLKANMRSEHAATSSLPALHSKTIHYSSRFFSPCFHARSSRRETNFTSLGNPFSLCAFFRMRLCWVTSVRAVKFSFTVSWWFMKK